MKKLIVIPALVAVLTASMPVLAVSPSADNTLTPAQQTEVTAEADALVASGNATTKAAAVAVATTVTKAKAAKALTTASITKEAEKVLAKMTDEQKAAVAAAAEKRNLSAEEVVGNFVKADPEIAGSGAVAWDANICKNSVNGKATKKTLIVSKPKDDVNKKLVADAEGKGKIINTLQVSVEGGEKYDTIETGLRVEGVTAKDTAENFLVLQLVNGKYQEVKITAVAKGVLALQLKGTGPIVIIRK